MAYILCILALLTFAMAGHSETAEERLPQDLDLETQEAMQKASLVQLLHRLFKSENGVAIRGGEDEDDEKREKRRRGLQWGSTNKLRGAGCRVFFWKSWTAC